jgi:tetratricopeptide (TPR) repeat protein
MQPDCAACGMSANQARRFFELWRVSQDPVVEAADDAAKGLFRRALAVLNELLLGNARNARVWEEKGKIYQIIGAHEAAVASYERALANGETPRVRIALGCALYDLGRHREAIEAYDILLERVPDGEWTAIALANQANSLTALGEHEQAEAGFRKAIALEPAEANHYYNYALCLSSQGQWDRALYVIDEGLRKAPSRHRDAALLAERARILHERERSVPRTVTVDPVAPARTTPSSVSRRTWYQFWKR